MAAGGGYSYPESDLTNCSSMDEGCISMVDTTSLERSSVQEELERKLLTRADRDDLIKRNILPAVSTSPILLAQTQQLQKAKTIDTLQQKLRDRVSRNQLLQRNILPDLKGDPSLQATQLQLRKKRLADDLNERLANRPGPLQLVQHRILEPANSELVQAVQTLKRPASSSSFTSSTSVAPDTSGTSLPPPPSNEQQRWSLGMAMARVHVQNVHPPPIVAQKPPDLSPGEGKLLESYSPVPSPGESLSPQKSPPNLMSPPSVSSGKTKQLYTSGVLSAGGKAPSPSQVRKKHQKPKYRKLRYHEYVPPNKSNGKGGKTSGSKASKMDTPYALLLQQQQLFLQLQVLQQQYPNGVLMQKLPELMKTDKNKPKAGTVNEAMRSGAAAIKTHEIPEDIRVESPSGTGSITVRLDELKVNNLKAACKELNLTVSGKKVDLIERLMEHKNGILPVSVLSDRRQGVNHTMSIDSTSAHSIVSPGSPDPVSVFQFPGGEQQEKSMDTTAIVNSVGSGVAQVLPASKFKQRFEQIVERQKIDYFSQKGMKTVTPRPDLKEMVAIIPCSTSASLSILPSQHVQAPNQGTSLSPSPKPDSPTDPTQTLLHEFMEHSPDSLATSLQSSSSTTSSLLNPSPTIPPPPPPPPPPTSSAGFFVKPYLRPVRSSLPNAASSQYFKAQKQGEQSSQLLYGSTAQSRGRIGGTGRSYSFSVAPPSHQHHALPPSSLSLDLPVSSSQLGTAGDTFLLPTPEDPSELMDVDTGFSSHDERLSDIFEILQNEDSGFNLGGSLSQPTPYSYLPSDKIQTRQDSTQSDTTMLNMAASNLAQQNRSGSDLCLPTGGNRTDSKTSATVNSGMSNGHFSDLGWLNLDNCCPLLGASPNLSSYCDMSAGTIGVPPPPDQFQLSLMEDPALNNSNGNLNALTSSGEMHPFLDSTSVGQSMLFGGDETHLLDHRSYR